MILTSLSRTINALSFFNQNEYSTWAVLGQYSPWDDESAPPNPSVSTTSVNEAFCAQIAELLLVEENDDSGTYSFVDTNGNTREFSAVSSSTFLSDSDTIILATTTITGVNIIGLEPSFRIVGFATNLVPASGHEDDTFLPVSNVSSFGNLIAVENRVAVSVISASSYAVSALLQF